MKSKLVLICSVLILSLNTNAQFEKIENLLINGKTDSAKFELAILNDTLKNEYFESLTNFANNTNISHLDMHEFISNRETFPFKPTHNFIKKHLYIPTDTTKIDLAYIEFLVDLVYLCRVDMNIIGMQNYSNVIRNYAAKFDETDVNFNKVIYLLNKLDLNSIIIDDNIKMLLKIANKNVDLAYLLEDTLDIIESLYSYSAIQICLEKTDTLKLRLNEAIYLDKLTKKESGLTYDLIVMLVELYIAENENKELILELLNENYQYGHKERGYYYYILFLQKYNLNEKEENAIFDKFEVKTYVQMCDTMISKSSRFYEFNKVELYNISKVCGELLYQKKFYSEFYDLSIKNSDLLIEILTENQTSIVAELELRKEKEMHAELLKGSKMEIDFQKKIKLGALILVTIFVVAFCLLYLLYKRLKRQNKTILKSENYKEILLKEVHHRVKNNFQIAISLLDLQVRGIDDENTKKLIAEGQNRIRSMALVHENLYKTDDFRVNLSVFITNLLMQIRVMHNGLAVVYKIEIDKKVTLNLDTATPLALIVNEIITNSYKYAFQIDSKNILNINLFLKEDFYQLVIQDNGKGLKDNFDYLNTKSTGFRLINGLSKQINGNFEYKYDKMASFIVNFMPINANSL